MGKGKNKSTNSKKLFNFSDERVKISIGIFFILFSIYLLLANISYLFTWQSDQSFEWQRVFSASSVNVDNWTGKLGAWLSDLLISDSFGIASIIFPFLLFLSGMRFFKIRLLPLRKTLRISLTGMIIFSITLGYFFSDTGGYLQSGLGGSHGYVVSRWLISLLGMTGTAFFILIITFSYIIFSFKRAYYFVISLFHTDIPEKESISQNTESQPEEDSKVNATDIYSYDEEPSTEEPVSNDGFKIHTPQNEEQVIISESDEIDQQTNPSVGIEVTNADGEELGHTEGSVEGEPEYDPTLDLRNYKYPTLELLEDHASNNIKVSNDELIRNKDRIVETLGNYKIEIDSIEATIGPTVTLYEIVPAPGIRISKIKNLEDDIALSLAALGIRIIAPMPGKGTIGIEVPNQNPDIVSMRSILSSKRFQESKFELPIALGKTISNETYVFELTKMPHLLVAGATGQGKSVGLNAIITSILYKKHPAQVKFVLVDPKKVELTLYSKIERHFLAKLPDSDDAIITDNQKVINTLNSLCIEMDDRYQLLQKAYVRNIKEYNDKFVKRKLNPNKGHRYLPYIVVIIDEFADLIMTAGREVETPIARLAQLARAIGIHLIIATQRPTTNIITGVIKANFPARIAFRVTSGVDSKTILDTTGANQLIGRGDMLIANGSNLVRVQCAFIDIPELEHITEYIGSQQGYPDALHLPEYVDENASSPGEIDLSKRDDMFDDAARLVVEHQQGSTSLIQRKFSIGYNRAGRIIDQLEAAGVVGPFEGSKARQVLFPDLYSLEQYLNDLNK